MNLRTHARISILTKDSKLTFDTLNRDVIQVKTSKDISNSSGVFAIILSARVAKSQVTALGTSYIPDLIKPYDLVQIEFKTDGGYKTEMIGYVARASLSLKVEQNSGAPERALIIEGFDLTKAIQNYKIFFNPYVTDNDWSEVFGGLVMYGAEKGKEIFRSKNAADFIKAFLKQAFLNTYRTHDPKRRSPYYGFIFGKNTDSASTGLEGTSPATQLTSISYDKTVGVKLNDLIDFEGGISTDFKGNTMIDPYILLGLGAGVEISLWDVVKSYSDPPFHECFIDLRRPNFEYSVGGVTKSMTVEDAESTHRIPPETGKFESPYVYYMRTTPFGKNSWNKLNRHEFYTSDVISQDTSTSEDNIFNYYQVICERENVLVGSVQLAALSAITHDAALGRPLIPIFDVPSIKNYGFKRFPGDKTKYVEFISNMPDKKEALDANSYFILKAQATLARELFRWYSFGEDFEDGTLVLKGRVGVGVDGVTIGSKLVECRPNGRPTGKEFYIEGVSQNWSFGKGLVTSLSVTRGHYPEDYEDAVTGKKLDGRNTKVAKREKELGLDQKTHSWYFENI